MGEVVSPDPAQPKNGTFFRWPKRTNGRGEVTLENGGGADALVKLVGWNAARRFTYCIVFVSAHQRFRLRGIPDGSYDVRFVLGRGWNTQHRRFIFDQSAHRFAEAVVFHTRRTESGESARIEWDTYELGLNATPTGTARVQEISSSEFFSDD